NDSKPSRDEITIGMDKAEITLTFELSKEELTDKEFMEIADAYIEDDKFIAKKIYAVDEKDRTKIKTAEIFVNEEKLKPASWKRISKYLPQYIYIESIRDIDRATKMTSSSILGKLIMPLIQKQNEV